MDTSLFDYELPQELIAQRPIEPRDASRLMVIDRASGSITHGTFRDLPSYLREGDCLVVNETRVMPARLLGRKAGTRGRVELLLLRPRTDTTWETLVKPGRRLAPGAEVVFGEDTLRARITERLPLGGRLVEFTLGGDTAALATAPDLTSEGRAAVARALKRLGEVPLPPYVHEPLADSERYQTVYAKHETSVAAPTAGLHFTEELLGRIESLGVGIVPVRLTVGLDTFRPVSTPTIEEHVIHSEEFELSEQAAGRINEARARGGRIISIGTTSARLLETVASEGGTVEGRAGSTSLFIHPGYRFKTVDALVTNFHLPRSSLLMLVSAFAGRELVMRAYREAVEERYRFFSFGDAMLIL